MTDLNDRLDNLFDGATSTVRMATRAPKGYKAPEQRFTEGCPKCRGRGRFISYAGRDCGPCFACKGAGRVSFKAAPETRAQNRVASAARKARSAEEAVAAFVAQFPAEGAWLAAAGGRGFNFAASMLDAIRHYGDLTENQLVAVRRCIAQDAARQAERAARVANAPAADTTGIDRLKAAFDAAIARTAEKGVPGLRLSNPRITVGGMTISPAKATSANPGAIYVKAGQQYLGKVTGGRFFASRECSPEQSAKVLSFIADPEAAAKAYGQETGVCCICNRTLRSDWRLKGIGPICAEKFGW